MNEEELERQLRDAVAAETEPVRVDEAASLTSIRERAATARRRRIVGATALGAAAALVIGIAIGAAAGSNDHDTNVAAGGPSTTIAADCASTTTTTAPPTTVGDDNGGGALIVGDGCGDDPTTTEPPSTPTSALPETTVPPSTTTTTSAPSSDDRIVYPFDGLGRPGASPEEVATAFLQAIGVADPVLGDFNENGWTEGTFEVHAGSVDGPVRSTLALERRDLHWVVVSAYTDPVDIRDARMVQDHALQLSGWGKGFEAVLHVQVIGHGGAGFHKEATVMANGQASASDPDLRTFTTNVDVSGSSGQVATIVISNEDKDGAPADFVAVTFQLP
jgi:hypothetical protein